MIKRKWKMSAWNIDQMTRRQVEPILEQGCVVNGCIPQDDYAEEVFEELESSAVAFGTLWESGDMPVIKMDDAFRNWRKEQIEQCKALTAERVTCLLPWQVLPHLQADQRKSDRLYFSQLSIPSCMGHADSFAHHSSTLYWIARGAPLVYYPFNPIVTWSITKGGSIRGGQTVSEMAKGANTIGHFPEHLVGTNNQAVPSYKEHLDAAKDFQSAIMFLNFKGKELADEIIQCCAAGLSVALGNSAAVSGYTTDSNGVKVAVLRGSWAHATHFTAYRVVRGTEYIGWVNSHGARYKSSDEGEPADMCWMDKTIARKFCSTMHQYGPPYAVFPESVTVDDRSFYVKQQIPWPNSWRF